MNPAKFIDRLKQTLLDHEEHYVQQERIMIQGGLPAGFENRWKSARKYLRKPKNKPLDAAHGSGAATLAVAVLTSFLWTDNPDQALYRLIYRYPTVDEEQIFQHNFAWLLLMRLLEDCQADQVLLPLEPDTDISDLEILQPLLTALRQWVFQNLYDELLKTPAPRQP